MMKIEKIWLLVGTTIITGMLIISCSSAAEDSSATDKPSETVVAEIPEMENSPETIAAVETPEAVEVWDYVALGDSVAQLYPTYFAAKIEADMGGAVEVNLINRYVGGWGSSAMLKSLQTNEKLRELIRSAEVITIMIPFGGCRNALGSYNAGGKCGGDDNQDCLRECMDRYKSDATAIFDELVSLRSPSEALIRTHDVYQFKVSYTQQRGNFTVYNQYWRDINQHVTTKAESHGIPVAKVYDAFMGASGTDAPEDAGLLVTDAIHTSSTGDRLIAELLGELGYEHTAP